MTDSLEGFSERHAAYYLKAWTAVARRTAGAPGGRACLEPAREGEGEARFSWFKATAEPAPELVRLWSTIASVSEIITVPLILEDFGSALSEYRGHVIPSLSFEDFHLNYVHLIYTFPSFVLMRKPGIVFITFIYIY